MISQYQYHLDITITLNPVSTHTKGKTPSALGKHITPATTNICIHIYYTDNPTCEHTDTSQFFTTNCVC